MPYQPYHKLSFTVSGWTPETQPAYTPMGQCDEDAKVIHVATTNPQAVISAVREFVDSTLGLDISSGTNDFWRSGTFTIHFDRSRKWKLAGARNAIFEVIARTNKRPEPVRTQHQPVGS